MKRNKKVIAAVIFSILFSLLFKWGQTGNPFSAETVMYATIILLNVLITGGIAYKLFLKYSNMTAIRLKTKIIPLYLFFVLLALLISLSLVSIGVYVFYLVKGLDTSNFMRQLFQVELAGAIKQFSVWILIGSAFFFYIIWRLSVEREHKLLQENLTYKYKNLKSQVNPHFLFNSLNTLSEIVYEDARKADNYIQKLSGIYRYILENEDTDLITLDTEVEFVKQYFDLQKDRNNDKIWLEIDISDAGQYQVLPVSLQILVENALKHNAMSHEYPLKIQIYNEPGYIVVSNAIQKKNTLESSTQTGLINLKERVKLIMDRELIVSEKDNNFVVKLPIIRTHESINN